MVNNLSRIVIALSLLLAHFAISAEYPNMEGRWSGNIRVVSSDTSGQVSTGGVIISESELVFTVDYQDGGTFIGRSRTSSMSASSEIINVWGSIRSNGDEAMFVTSTGGNGLIWFENSTAFEYCYTNITEGLVMAYCAKLTKQE